jgi:r-opsin
LTTCSFDFLSSSITDRAFILTMCIAAYVAPLVFIGAAYTGIIWNVYSHSKCFRTLFTPSNQKNSKFSSKMRREISTAKVTSIAVVCWAIAWTPYAVVALMGISSDTAVLTPLAAQLPAVFAKTAAVYNPFGKKEIKMNPQFFYLFLKMP